MYRLGFTVALAAIIAAGTTCAQATMRVGEANSVERNVFGSQVGQGQRKVLQGDDVYENDLIRTETASSARILFVDDTDVNIGPAAALKLDRVVFNPDQSVRALTVIANEGAIRWTSGHSLSSTYQIKTPTALVRVHGTTLDLFVEPRRTTVLLREGIIEVCLVNEPDHCRTVSVSGDLISVTSSGIEGPRQGGLGASDFAALCLSAASPKCILAASVDPPAQPSRKAAIGKPEHGISTSRSSAAGGSVATLPAPPKPETLPPPLGYNPATVPGNPGISVLVPIPLPPLPNPVIPPPYVGTKPPPNPVIPPPAIGVGTKDGQPQPDAPPDFGVASTPPPAKCPVDGCGTASPVEQLKKPKDAAGLMRQPPVEQLKNPKDAVSIIRPRDPISRLAATNLQNQQTISQGTVRGTDNIKHRPMMTPSSGGNQTTSHVRTPQSIKPGRIQRVHNESSSSTGHATKSPNHIQRVHNASSGNTSREFSKGRAQYNSRTSSTLHATRNHANVSADRAVLRGSYQRSGAYAAHASPFRPNYVRPAQSFGTSRSAPGFAQHQYRLRRTPF